VKRFALIAAISVALLVTPIAMLLLGGWTPELLLGPAFLVVTATIVFAIPLVSALVQRGKPPQNHPSEPAEFMVALFPFGIIFLLLLVSPPEWRRSLHSEALALVETAALVGAGVWYALRHYYPSLVGTTLVILLTSVWVFVVEFSATPCDPCGDLSAPLTVGATWSVAVALVGILCFAALGIRPRYTVVKDVVSATAGGVIVEAIIALAWILNHHWNWVQTFGWWLSLVDVGCLPMALLVCIDSLVSLRRQVFAPASSTDALVAATTELLIRTVEIAGEVKNRPVVAVLGSGKIYLYEPTDGDNDLRARAAYMNGQREHDRLRFMPSRSVYQPWYSTPARTARDRASPR
jgi:hypothetical protein